MVKRVYCSRRCEQKRVTIFEQNGDGSEFVKALGFRVLFWPSFQSSVIIALMSKVCNVEQSLCSMDDCAMMGQANQL